jgi:HlyD family secretion protein
MDPITPEQPPSPAPPRREHPRSRPRRWLPYAVAVVLGGLLVAGFWPQPVPVETASASIGKLRATVNEEGKTRIKQRYVVSAPVTGQLRRMAFKAGAEVLAGETVLAFIDPLSPVLLDARARLAAEARRNSAAANLAKARAAHTFAANDLNRFEKLFQEKTISVQELETSQWRATAAAKEEAAAESALRQAEVELQEFAFAASSGSGPPTAVEVKAPISGRVLRVFEENSRVVSAGTPLLELGDPTNLEVVIDVLSRDGASIPAGAKVEFEQWSDAEASALLGRVRLVEPAAFTKVSALGVEEQRVNVIADLLTPPAQRPGVGDGFRVEARIVIWETDRALKVPAGALFRQGGQWAVFVLANGRAQLRLIKVGRAGSNETQVLEGLKEGEEVILYPGSRVRNGQRARPIRI